MACAGRGMVVLLLLRPLKSEPQCAYETEGQRGTYVNTEYEHSRMWMACAGRGLLVLVLLLRPLVFKPVTCKIQ